MMKKILFIMLPAIFFSQETKLIKLRGSIKDKSGMTKSLGVIDNRENKVIGTSKDLNPEDNKTKIYTLTLGDNLDKDIAQWFDSSNKVKGTNDLFLQLEEVTVNDETEFKKQVSKYKVKASVFKKDNGAYYFLSRYEGIGVVNTSIAVDTPGEVAASIGYILRDLVNSSYTATPSKIALTDSNIKDYDTIMKSQLAAYKTQNLKDGIYLDHKSFFDQTPEEGFTVKKNNNGVIVRAERNGTKISANKIYAYVENGKAYKNTATEDIEIQKDDKGYFLFTNRGHLILENTNSTYVMFGLIGGIAGAIETNAKNKKNQKAEKYNIYLDPLTGEYIFEK
ncbi:hypothetical protein ACV0BM_008815 [Elizabethkingia meningoseptica]